MKQQINEIRRMQQLAGILKENQLNEAEKEIETPQQATNLVMQKIGRAHV